MTYSSNNHIHTNRSCSMPLTQCHLHSPSGFHPTYKATAVLQEDHYLTRVPKVNAGMVNILAVLTITHIMYVFIFSLSPPVLLRQHAYAPESMSPTVHKMATIENWYSYLPSGFDHVYKPTTPASWAP